MDLRHQLERAYARAGAVVDGVRPEHLDAPTPCPLYDVRGVLDHLVGVLDMFTGGLTGSPVSRQDLDRDRLGDDPAAAFRGAATANLAAWRRPGALDGTIELPFGTMPAAVSGQMNLVDSIVHAWDVAKATGQGPTIPDDLAEPAFAFVRQMLKPEMRSDAPDASFGREVEVPADAPVTDRLVAFLGRQP